MKLTKRDIEDLVVLVNHAQQDVRYGSEGNYVYRLNKFDEKEAKRVKRAIELIDKMVTFMNEPAQT